MLCVSIGVKEWPVRATLRFPHLALSFCTPWLWTVVTSVPVADKDAPARKTGRLKGTDRPAILLVCPGETGARDSGCSNAGGRGRTDHVEW